MENYVKQSHINIYYKIVQKVQIKSSYRVHSDSNIKSSRETSNNRKDISPYSTHNSSLNSVITLTKLSH